MTPIVSRASKHYVLQVTGAPASDVIIYAARNGIASICSTGLESIEGIRCSGWLAQHLHTPSHDLGHALLLLCRALKAAPLDPARPLDIHVVGWQRSRRRWRPIVAGITRLGADTHFSIEYLPRYWHFDRGSFNVTAAPDTHICIEQLQRVVGRLRNLEPDEAEQILAGVIGQMSGKAHSVRILLERPPDGRIRIRHGGTGTPARIGPGIESFRVTLETCD